MTERWQPAATEGTAQHVRLVVNERLSKRFAPTTWIVSEPGLPKTDGAARHSDQTVAATDPMHFGKVPSAVERSQRVSDQEHR